MPAKRRWTALRCGFDRLQLDEVVAFTTEANTPSQKVMQAIGMHYDPLQILHTPRSQPMTRCAIMCWYRITRAQWLDTLHG